MSHQDVNLRVDKISAHAQLLQDKIAKMKRRNCSLPLLFPYMQTLEFYFHGLFVVYVSSYFQF